MSNEDIEMSFQQKLLKARGHFVFLGALLCGLGLVVALENSSFASPNPDVPKQDQKASPLVAFAEVEPLPLAIIGESSAQDIEYAKIAWRYFENNTNPETGLANSADKYPRSIRLNCWD